MSSDLQPPFGIVLLAAGESRRLGFPKQLALWEGEPLARRAARSALETDPAEVIVVLGARAEEVRKACDLGDPRLKFVENPSWQDGMGSSISKGVTSVAPSSHALLLMLCDQPRVPSAHLAKLIEALDRDSEIVATLYADRLGAPCAFRRSVFPDLANLRSDEGARSIIRDPSRTVRRVTCEEAAFDIDLPSDLSQDHGDSGPVAY